MKKMKVKFKFYLKFTMTITFTDYIWFIINILKVIIPYSIIINPNLYYSPLIIVISDILYSTWILYSEECYIITTNNINSLVIFNSLVSVFIAIVLNMHAIWNKKYLAVIWIVLPISLGFMRGLSCSLESIMKIHIK